MVGTIIGAGIFAVPAMIGQWGVILGSFGFAVVVGIVIAVHALFVEAIVLHPGHARFAGQAAYWFGPWMKYPAAIIHALFIIGSNFAYVLLGGGFLAALAHLCGVDAPLLLWQILFWIAATLIVGMRFDWMSKIEAALAWVLVGVIVLIIFIFVPHLDGWTIFDVRPFIGFQPYGVFLFAMLGLTAIPEANDIVEGRRDDVLKSVTRATILAGILTWGYGITAWMVSGGTLSTNPADVAIFLPSFLVWLIPVFGLLAVITSYITSAIDVRNMCTSDLRSSKAFAWFIAVVLPILLLFVTTRDLLTTIGFVGSIFGAAFAILAAFMGQRALLRHENVKIWSRLWWWREAGATAVVILLTVGAVIWLFFHA